MESKAPESVFAVCDNNTRGIAERILADAGVDAHMAEIAHGDENKTLDAAVEVWNIMTEKCATRASVVLNIGGGMVTDLGGWAAATYKRGVSFINIPTTLLGAIDAAIGGKTGINFHGLKNQIGCFAPADTVIISTEPMASLPYSELMSGYGEMLKHALLKDEHTVAETLSHNPIEIDRDRLLAMMKENIAVKQQIVAADPHEKGLRKALNLGHTAGHAYESLALAKGSPVPHGHAVAWGLVTDLVLSHMRYGFHSTTLHAVAAYIKEYFAPLPIGCGDYSELLRLMSHDKKNQSADRIVFTLLRSPGDVVIDSVVSKNDIEVALDLTRDLIQ